MKRRIFWNMLTLSSAILLVAATVLLLVYYRYFSKELEKEVAHDGIIICKAINVMDDEQIKKYLDNFFDEDSLRITLIKSDGEVLYDNMQDSYSLENHLDRPEIIQAIEHGEGQDTRYSMTSNGQAYYYAVALDNGNIIRVAYMTDDITRLFYSVIPMFIICLAVCLTVCLVLTGRLTANIIQPINTMDLQNPSMEGVYDELRPLMLRIKHQNDERAKNEKMRQEFSANVSHELKTPLTSISGYAELLKSGIVSEEDVPDFANKIFKEAGRMGNLVNDIIKISKLDEHRVGVEKDKVDLLHVALDVKDQLELVAKNQKVTVQVLGQHTDIFAVDQMMNELIYNLCENAIKYNKPGGKVTMTVSRKNGRGCIEVSDTGIGIPKESQERIFERFYRVDKSHSRQTGGTGLGLAIVKHIVEYHQGEISLRSTPGEGTTITVRI